MQGRALKRLGLGTAAVAIAGGIAVAVLSYRPVQRADLGGGTTLEWLGVTQGTNEFSDGSPLERLLGNAIPAGGIEVASIRLERSRSFHPIAEADLTGWFVLRGFSRQLPAGLLAEIQVRVGNRTGRRFDHPGARPYLSSVDRILYSVPLQAFPRDEKRVRVELRMTNGPIHEAAIFEFENPFRNRPERWTAAPLPATNRIEGVDFVLAEACANPAVARFQIPAGWTLVEAAIADEEGNCVPEGRLEHSASGESDIRFNPSLESNRTWKVEALFLRADGYPMGNVDYPAEERRALTVVANTPASLLTNTAGETFLCSFDGESVSLHSQSAGTRPFWVMLAARDETGKRVGFSGSGASMRPHNGPESLSWPAGKGHKQLSLELACPKFVRADFYVRPTIRQP